MELLWSPRKEALSKITEVKNEPEMTEFESAFVCGLIKENNPKKILEIGVAAGGTTAIIIQCISDLEMNDCEFISVDLNEKYYRGDGRDTGFLGKEIKNSLSCVNHRFILGHVIAEVIDDIGRDIDLVILDTVHFLPGEVLDFPVILPYLSKDAIVVLHDTVYHQYSAKEGVATQVLIDVATGNRIVPLGLDERYTDKMPNIAAIRINEDTLKYIDAVFYSMTLPWYYFPKEGQIDAYRKLYSRYYDKEMLDIFDMAVCLNKKRLEKPCEKHRLYDRICLAARMLLKGH